MQFNPLFLNDTGNTQTLVSKNNKMQSNRYLFSDIVKVVMQDDEGNRKLKNITIDEKVTDELNPLANMDLITEELQTKTITGSENELMKLQLADILPADMAELLINENATISDDKAISFVGKEQLEGELKNFITGLVGEEIIENNVSNNKGLLLRLEDHKSAVNIEITKELNPKLSSDKIVVQALVVPEKSKIQSLTNTNKLVPFGNTKQILQPTKVKRDQIPLVSKTESILRSDVKDAQILEGIEKQNSLGQSEIKQGINTKATLSVFSFNTKYNNDSGFGNSSSKQDLNALVNSKISTVEQTIQVKGDGESTKVKGNIISIEKLQEPKLHTETNKEISKDLKLQTINTLIPNLERPKSNDKGKNYNVSQITIVKKQPISLEGMKETINIKDKRVDATLRKIDFNSVEKNQIKSTSKQVQKNDENIRSEKSATSIQNQKSGIGIQNKEMNVGKSELELKSKIKAKSGVELKGDVKAKNDLTQTKSIQKENLQTTDNVKIETVTQDVKIEENGSKILSKKHEHITRKKEITKDEISTEEKNVELPKEVANKGEIPIVPNKKVSVKVKKGIKLANVRTEQEIPSVNNLNNQTRSEFDTNPDLAGSNNSQAVFNTENNLEIKNKPIGTFQHKLNGELVNAKDEMNIISQEVRQENSERIVKSIEVIKEISRFISKQEKGTLSFRINPEHLGSLKITLDSAEQSITANIQVENEQAKQLVEKNIHELQNQLKENGVELSSLNISLRNPKSNKEEMGEQGNSSTGNSENSNQEEIIEEKANRSLGYNTYEYLA